MVIYHAVKGVDEHENPDLTAENLVQLIGDNCHTVVVDEILRDSYSRHIKELLGKPWLQLRTVDFILRIVENSAKFVVESAELPELPATVKIPQEDEYVVRAALMSHPVVVTAEKRLLKAINSQSSLLHLIAKSPSEALELAKDS